MLREAVFYVQISFMFLMRQLIAVRVSAHYKIVGTVFQMLLRVRFVMWVMELIQLRRHAFQATYQTA